MSTQTRVALHTANENFAPAQALTDPLLKVFFNHNSLQFVRF